MPIRAMNGSVCLRRLHASLATRLNRVSRRIQQAHAEPYSTCCDCVARSTIDTLNLWNGFLRAYYFSYIVRAKTISRASRLCCTTHIPDVNHAIGYAWQAVNPNRLRNKPISGPWSRREEPAWHDKNNFLNTLNHIGAVNYSNVQSAFSINTRALGDLVIFRNYFAHRNQSTFDSAFRLAHMNQVVASKTPTKVLLSRPLGRSSELLIEWICDLEAISSLMCG